MEFSDGYSRVAVFQKSNILSSPKTSMEYRKKNDVQSTTLASLLVCLVRQSVVTGVVCFCVLLFPFNVLSYVSVAVSTWFP